MGVVDSGVIIIVFKECADSIVIGAVASIRRHRVPSRPGLKGLAASSANRRAIRPSGLS